MSLALSNTEWSEYNSNFNTILAVAYEANSEHFQLASPFVAYKEFCTYEPTSEGLIPPELLKSATVSTADHTIGMCKILAGSNVDKCYFFPFGTNMDMAHGYIHFSIFVPPFLLNLRQNVFPFYGVIDFAS